MSQVNLHDYNIVVEQSLSSLNDWLNKSEYSQFIVLVDELTKQHCWPIFKDECSIDIALLIEITSGEQHKNIDTCQAIWKQLLDVKIDRKALFINLGGGVIGDMGGFAASCYKRGIDFINVPTTVLSQVDASIGGKLGIDFKYGKNLIGLFKNPKHIHISTRFHQSLPDRQYKNGFSEIYKHALIGDAEQWTQLAQIIDLRTVAIDAVVYQSLLVKKHIVETDPYEQNIRKALNFGHTIGHAIETYSLAHDDDPLLHGEAIIIGMIMEAYLSIEKVGLSEKELQEIVEVFRSKFTDYQINIDKINEIWSYMLLDKKNEKTKVFAALISCIGQAEINIELTKADLEKAIVYYRQITTA